LLRAGRLWTPDPQLNRAVQAGRLETLRWVQRLPSGLAPHDRSLVHLQAVVESLDSCDVIQSRNLLAHVRRVAERSQGQLPAQLPLRASDPLAHPGLTVIETNSSYLLAFYTHLRHHFDLDLLREHQAAIKLCAETLIQQRWQPGIDAAAPRLATIGAALRRAVGLAVTLADSVNAVRWESEACEAERRAEELGAVLEPTTTPVEFWLAHSTWQRSAERPWHFLDPIQGIRLAGQAVWQGCGIEWSNGHYTVQPHWPPAWHWWALLDLPSGSAKLSLLWDGTTLHATQPVHSSLPVQLHQRILALKTDEHDFDLQFELRSEQAGLVEKQLFRPKFLEIV
jgi:hypothetical protein